MDLIHMPYGHGESLKVVDSDYGSDIDDDTWDAVLVQAESNPLTEIAIEDIQDINVIDHDSKSQHLSLRLPSGQDDSSHARHKDQTALQRNITSDKAAVNRTSVQPQLSSRLQDDNASEQPIVAEKNDDSQTPLQRFRTSPKKPLSVTDFVSPAWCELQYWYSLIHYGRVRRTPAMKAGSKIHKEKEREVYIEVPVETHTREDRMGLRLWNIIHGLRNLRSNGLTRELEVFGLIDGEVVIGIIDEITSTCPDEEMEANILNQIEVTGAAMTDRKKGKGNTVTPDQRSMKDFFHLPRNHGSNGHDNNTSLASFIERPSTHYLVDIKTRGVKNMPHKRQMKPTLIQLMMYRQMLMELAANRVDADAIFNRYQLDQKTRFSDIFIAELANLDTGHPLFEVDEVPSADPLDEITSHNNLNSLWSLMIEEFRKALPVEHSPSVISPLLTAEYRTSKRGDFLGKKCFAFDAGELNAHVRTTLRWWRGERPAKGVEIEDAWKCSICEFAEHCTWRVNKIEEATQKARHRNQTMKKCSK